MISMRVCLAGCYDLGYITETWTGGVLVVSGRGSVTDAKNKAVGFRG